MKIFVVICFAFIANVLGKPTTDEQQKLFHDLNLICGMKSGIDQATLAEIEAYRAFPEDDKMKIQNECLLEGVAVIDEGGNIDAAALSAVLKMIVPGKEDEIVKKCNVGKDHFALGKCVFSEINAARG